MDLNRVPVNNKERLKPYSDDLECCNSHKVLHMGNFGEKGPRMGQGEKKNELVIARMRVKSPRQAQDGN